MTRNDGGPAFPTVIASPNDFPDGSTLPLGMSLRDWFAGMALCGSLSHPKNDGYPHNQAEWAYETADAMLSERAKVKP